jgi:PST family polysaccharide transporter
MPVNQLSYPLTNVAVAALSRLRDDPEQYRAYYSKALSMIAFIGMPLSAVLTIVGKDLVILLLGPQWNKAGEIFTAFAPGIGVLLLYGTHGWLHLSLGRADRWFRWGLVELILTVCAFVVGLPFGALGVAVAYTASFYVLILPGLLYAAKPIDISLSSLLSPISKYYVCALASGILSWFILYSSSITSNLFLGQNIIIRIFVSTVFCFVLYLALVVLCYQNIQPILQFVSILHNMMPKLTKKTM